MRLTLARGSQAKHPQWFYPRNADTYGQLCWHNESLVEFVQSQVLAMLHTQPNATVLSISQNDNVRFCQDPAEVAIVNAEGSDLAPMLRAVNRIAAAVRKEFPTRDIWIDTFAYTYTRTPPNITVPAPNVAIRYASWLGWWDLAQPAPAPKLQDNVEVIRTWGREAGSLIVWDYIVNFVSHVALCLRRAGL